MNWNLAKTNPFDSFLSLKAPRNSLSRNPVCREHTVSHRNCHDLWNNEATRVTKQLQRNTLQNLRAHNDLIQG